MVEMTTVRQSTTYNDRRVMIVVSTCIYGRDDDSTS